MQTKRTALVDSQGWTLQEFNTLLTEDEVMQFVTNEWHIENARITHQPNINPPQTFVEAKTADKGGIEFICFIRVRE